MCEDFCHHFPAIVEVEGEGGEGGWRGEGRGEGKGELRVRVRMRVRRGYPWLLFVAIPSYRKLPCSIFFFLPF